MERSGDSMRNKLISILKEAKKSTITLSELETIADSTETYEEFSTAVFHLLDEEYIKPIKIHGVNWRGLPFTFRIQKGKVKQSLIDSIQQQQFQLHPAIGLQAYYSSSEKKWHEDLKWIKKIDKYLKEHGLPTVDANSSERSYQLVKDEKWIDEKEGKAILEKIQLFEKLKIIKAPDPLMFSLNSKQIISNQRVHKHLVVENKATYYGLIDTLTATSCTTLIYGAGWKIVSSLKQLSQQLGLDEKEHQHEVYYFGDLDHEGISIFHHLHEKYHVKLATEFYTSLIKKTFYKGKETQISNEEAIQYFLKKFTTAEQEKIIALLSTGGYYPQEALSKKELENIWRNVPWAQV